MSPLLPLKNVPPHRVPGHPVGKTDGIRGGEYVRIKPAPPLGLLTGHQCPPNGHGIFENPGLDGFVFGGLAHVEIRFAVGSFDV
jgi:hypothetical protein